MKMRGYFEPWTARASRSWESSFPSDLPLIEDPEQLDRWQAARSRAERDAEWTIWGSGMFEPSACLVPGGSAVVMDDSHLIARIRRPVTSVAAGADQAAIAVRITQCVNACRGMADPEGAIADTRALLVDLACGRADPGDPRVLRCLVRLAGPPPAPQPTEEEWTT